MKIIDINEAFYVASEIAYMFKDKTIDDKPVIKIYLKGNPVIFTIRFDSVETRDKYYNEYKHIISNL